MARETFLTTNAPWLSAGALLMFLSSFGQTFFISIFAGEIQQQFDLSHGAWGSIYAIGTTASAVVMVWAGVLTDHYRARTLGTICLIGLAVSCLFMAFNPYLALLPVVIFCLRLSGQGMISHIAVVAMARWFVATRGKALSISTLGFSLGESLLPVALVFLMAYLDWHWLWVLAAGVCLAAALLLRVLLKSERIPSASAKENIQAGMDGRHWTRKEVLGHSLFWFMLPAIVGLSAFGTAYFFHQVHFAQIKGISHLAFVAMLPVYSFTAIGLMILSGIALDRYGTPRLIIFYQIPVVLAFFVAANAGSLLTVGLSLVLFGMTTGSNGTLTNALWAEVYGTAHMGAIKSMAAAAMVLGSAIGPALTGAFIDWGVGLETQYQAVAVYFIGSSLLMWLGMAKARSRLTAPA